ncbi:AAA family ATPase [bacterium]|nr:MAG: AAA family ATPase [bacterium]
MIQSQAFSILKTGANIFLTGEPGSGKTYTVNRYVEYLRARDVEPAITASTGIAATHIGGMTIHSWCGIGIKTKLDERDLNKIAGNEYIAKRVRRTKVLIIDEVSMLTAETLCMVDAVCREVKLSMEPFGGMQVVFVGDFFQLPPVVRASAEDNAETTFIDEPLFHFAYTAFDWTRVNPVVCYLTEQYRQDDDDFIAMLSAIRRNAFGENQLRYIEARKKEHHSAPDGAPRLFSHNADVDRINEGMLSKLSGERKAFAMSSQGFDALVAILKKGCISPEALYLKTGAAVMFTKNNLKKGFVNGTLGVVDGFNKTNGNPVIKIRSGQLIEAEPVDWTMEENGKVRARITQLPLRLAWAITVHKSQGMSLDEAVMDLSRVFEFGQGYVALSRVRRLSGIFLLGWNERAFKVHPEILAKDEFFRAESETAKTSFAEISSDELEKRHKHFIDACGGINISRERTSVNLSGDKKANKSGINLETIREQTPNAYRPWDEAQDEKLRELFTKNLSTADIAGAFGRKKGAISSRLRKLGLVQH